MAMNRKVATIETGFRFSGLDTAKSAFSRFTTGIRTAFGTIKGDPIEKAGKDGARGLDKANDSAKKLSNSLKDVVAKSKSVASFGRGMAGRAASVAGAGVLGGAVGAAVQGGVVGKAVSGNKEISDDIDAQARMAKTIGMSIEEFSLLAAFGRRFKVEAQDLGSVLVQFSGVLNDAAKGEGAGAEFFEELGIKATDAAGNIRPIVDVLNDVARTSMTLTGAKKGAFLAAMFGEGDAAKMSTMVEALGQLDKEAFTDVSVSIAKQGGGFTAQDALNAQLYQIQLERMADSWRRLKRSTLAATGPQLQNFFFIMSSLIAQNADLIANKLSVALHHMLRLLYDMILLALGYQPIKHGWIVTVAAGIWLAIDAIKAFIAFLPTALTFAKDAWYVLTFQDSKASGENPGLRRLRDQIIRFGLWLAQEALKIADVFLWQIGLALGQLNLLFLQVKLAWLDVVLAWQTGNPEGAVTPIGRFIGEISQAIMWLQALKQSIVDVFWFGGEAQPGFEWVETAKQKWDEFAEKLSKAWDWLKTIFTWWEKLFAFFGIDLKTTLLFLGLLKMLGLLWMLTIPLKVMGSLLTGFLTGLAQGLGARVAGGAAAGGMAALIGGIGGAIKGFGAACMAAFPLVAKFALVAAALFAAFKVGGEIGKFMAEWVNDFDGQIQTITGKMKADDDVYMRNKGLIDDAGRYTDLARSQLSITALSPALQNFASTPSDLAPVNIFWKGDDAYPAQFYAQESELQKLLSSDQFSLTRR